MEQLNDVLVVDDNEGISWSNDSMMVGVKGNIEENSMLVVNGDDNDVIGWSTDQWVDDEKLKW